MKFNSLPVDAPLRITSKFGKRNTGISNASLFHKGVDLGRDFSKPETKVLAVAAGTITENYWNKYRGWVVVVKHNDMYSTLYQHLKEQCPLLLGSKVSSGDVLGIMGNSSDPNVLKIAVHLHFELHENGVEIDPMPYLIDIKDEVLDLTEVELKDLVCKTIQEVLSGGNTKTPSNWAKKSWEEAVENGIVDGTKPKGYATREQVVQIVKNAVK